MRSPAQTNQISLKDLVEQILFSRQITRSEESRLISTLSSQHLLDEEQQVMIQRVLYGLRHGLLQVVD
jgi:hypothetical protein